MVEKVWMITGASRGLGAEIAKAVLAAGDKLIATVRNAHALDHLGSRENIIAVSMDVTNEAQVKSGVGEGLGRFGRIDVLVNNAGFGLLGAVEETTAAAVERIYRTNVFGLLHVTRAVLPTMRRQRSGHIINLSSLGGYRASAVERTGADVQFILPGNGWLLCWGGVANPHDTLPRRQTALSLRGVREQSHCLNAVTAHCSICLLEDLVAGRLTQLV